MRALGRPVLDLIARLRANLSPGSYFVLQMTVGLLVFAAAAWLFGGIAEDVVTGDPLILHDLEVERWFHLHQTPRLNRFLSGVSRLHEWPAVTGATVLVMLYLLWRRDWRWVTTVICAVPGGCGRCAPESGFSSRPAYVVQSGRRSAHLQLSERTCHGGNSDLWVSAAYLITRLAAWHFKVLAVLIACSLVAVVAFSRVYLGVHYLSDVLAAASAGVTWLALSLVAVDTLWYRRGRQPYSDVG